MVQATNIVLIVLKKYLQDFIVNIDLKQSILINL